MTDLSNIVATERRLAILHPATEESVGLVLLPDNSIVWTWEPDVVNYHVRMEMFPSQPTTNTVGGITLHYGVYR